METDFGSVSEIADCHTVVTKKIYPGRDALKMKPPPNAAGGEPSGISCNF